MLELSLIVLGLLFVGFTFISRAYHLSEEWAKASFWNRLATWAGALWTASMLGYLVRPFLR